MTETRTRETVALEWLQRFGPLASWQFNLKEFTGYSERTIATGINNLVHAGKVREAGRVRKYKVWEIVNPGQLELGVE